MKIEKVTVERRQIVFSDVEFSDIHNARCWLKNALQFAPEDIDLQRVVNELENILDRIDIQDNGNYYVLSEEVRRDDA